MTSTEKESWPRSLSILLLVMVASLVAYRFGELCNKTENQQNLINDLLTTRSTLDEGPSAAVRMGPTSLPAAARRGRSLNPARSGIKQDTFVAFPTSERPTVSQSSFNRSPETESEARYDFGGAPPNSQGFDTTRPVALDTRGDISGKSRLVSDVPKGLRGKRLSLDDFEEIMPIELDGDFPAQAEELPLRRSQRDPEPINVPKLSEVAPLDALKDLITSTQLTSSPSVVYWSLDDAINAALHFSFRIDALRIQAFENYQDVGIEFGSFDTAFFLEQRLGETNQPVGNNFESDGAAARIRGQESSLRWGLRKQLLAGGSLQIDDNTELRDDNSGVLNPPNQARSGLNIEFSQPLLRGSGKSVAMNQVLVAAHNATAQKVRSTAEIASLVNSVSTAYWDLYIARGQIIATLESIKLSNSTVRDLEARKTFDADPNILEQARRTVQQLKIILGQRTGALRDAQIELASLINAPELMGNITEIEIIPVENAFEDFNACDIPTLVATGLRNRPEIQEALELIKASAVENHLSVNQLLPELNLILNASFDGLAGDRDISAAAVNRFDSNGTYSVGFDVNVPLANRAARFQQRQSELALKRLNREFQDTVEQVKRDIRSAANAMKVNDQQWFDQKKVLRSTVISLQNLEARQYRAPRAGTDSAFQLTQILSAQSEISDAKSAFIEALANRQKAVVDLNRATGILVNQVDAGLPNSTERNQPITVFRHFRNTRDAYWPQALGLASDVRTASRPMRSHGGSHQFGYPDQHFSSFDAPAVIDQDPFHQQVTQVYEEQPISSMPIETSNAPHQHYPPQSSVPTYSWGSQ